MKHPKVLTRKQRNLLESLGYNTEGLLFIKESGNNMHMYIAVEGREVIIDKTKNK